MTITNQESRVAIREEIHQIRADLVAERTPGVWSQLLLKGACNRSFAEMLDEKDRSMNLMDAL